MDNLLNIRKGGNVKRFHTVTMLREHLVSSHSWGVAAIVCEILPEPSVNLLKACLYHDVAEYVTGDVSAPTKWQNPGLAKLLDTIEAHVAKQLKIHIELTPEEKHIHKYADMADLVLNCLEEYNLGNMEAGEIVIRGMKFLDRHIHQSDVKRDEQIYIPHYGALEDFHFKLDDYVSRTM